MSDCSQLPTFFSYLQALAAPITGGIVTYIAWRQMKTAQDQMRTAQEKLHHDKFEKLYDRRVAIYEATRAFLASVYEEEGVTKDAIRAYTLITLDAKFLFDEDLYKYLREIRDRVAQYAAALESERENTSSENKAEHRRIANQRLEWIGSQGEEHIGFDVKFKQYLIYEPPDKLVPARCHANKQQQKLQTPK